MSVSNVSAFSAALLAFAVTSCATQQAAQREANGISVAVSPQAKCTTHGPAKTPLPDGQLCDDLRSSFARELQRAGFTVVDSAGDGFTLTLNATQEMPAEGKGAALSVEVRVKKGSEEIDVEGAQTDDLTAAAASEKIGGVARELAAALADSPRLKARRS